MQVNHQFEIDAPIERVWDVVGNGFAEIGEWSTAVPASQAHGGASDLPHAPVAGRSCQVAAPGFGAISEKLIGFDPATHTLTYRVEDGMPRFVSEAQNTWRLTPIDDRRTKVSMTAVFASNGIVGKVTVPILKFNVRRTLASIERDLSHYLTTGRPSQAKTNQVAKAG